MKYNRIFLFFGFMIALACSVRGQKPDPGIGAIERHYQYLEEEAKANRETMDKEAAEFREFVQNERNEHQEFLETTIKWGAGLLGLAGLILAFFGWNNFKGIQDSINSAAERLKKAQKNLEKSEKDYNKLLSYYKNINPIEGRYLLIGTKEKLEVMKQQEVPRFEAAWGKIELLTTQEMETNGFYEASYDVIIYRYSPTNDQGEDNVLEGILLKLKNGTSVPVLVYSVGQSEYIKGSTDSALKKYGLFHVANNPVTLIDNAASTYRVSKLSIPKQASQI